MSYKPLLAHTVEKFDQIVFPVIASPKLDGIRCETRPNDDLLLPCAAVSRNIKPIPNEWVRRQLEGALPPGLDGELVVVDDDGEIIEFHAVSSAIMSRHGDPNFRYLVFDYIGTNDEYTEFPFAERLTLLGFLNLPKFVQRVEQRVINNLEELEEYEAFCIDAGYEGVMIRHPKGRYKFGRSTEREGILGKIKRFVQDEASILHSYEAMENLNPAVRNATGHLERSSHKDNKVGKGMLGGYVVKPVEEGPITEADREWITANLHRLDSAVLNHPSFFNVGSGFTQSYREEHWTPDEQSQDLQRIITYKHQKSGAKAGGKPRFPIFKGIRHPHDL